MTERQYEKFKNQVVSIVASLQGAQEYFVELKISYGSFHHLFVFYRPEKNNKGLFVHKCKYGRNGINVWYHPDINEIFLVDISKGTLIPNTVEYFNYERRDARERREILSDKCRIDADDLIKKMDYFAISVI